MRLKLSTWNAILLGPTILAIQYLLTPGTTVTNRAVAVGLLFFLTPSVIVLIVVDAMALRRSHNARKASS